MSMMSYQLLVDFLNITKFEFLVYELASVLLYLSCHV